MRPVPIIAILFVFFYLNRLPAQTQAVGQATISQTASQKAEEPKTQVEKFQARSGGVIIKGYSDVGSVPGKMGGLVDVTSMEFTDAASGTRQFGIAIEVKETSQFERTNRSYIDFDEIDSLLKGIDYVSGVQKNATKLTNVEAIYRTRGDFKITRFNSSAGAASGMMVAVESGSIAGTRVFLEEKDLTRLRELLQRAQATLQAIK